MQGVILDKKNNPVIVRLKTEPVKNKVEAGTLLAGAILKLNQIYRQVPKPYCNSCGECCDGKKTGNPVIYSIEYLNMASFLNSPSNKELRRKIYSEALSGKSLLNRRVAETYAKIKEQPGVERCDRLIPVCPAFDRLSKLCLLYDYRPLICRLYGLDGWYKGLDGWSRKAKLTCCNQFKISEDDRTEHWALDSGDLLVAQLKRLSTYYYADETTGVVFNENEIISWFALKLRG